MGQRPQKGSGSPRCTAHALLLDARDQSAPPRRDTHGEEPAWRKPILETTAAYEKSVPAGLPNVTNFGTEGRSVEILGRPVAVKQLPGPSLPTTDGTV